MITFDQVTKSYPTGDIVLDDLSFQIEPQEFVALSGSSGAGKTTLLRLIYKELEPTSGKITVDGQDLSTIKPSNLHHFRGKIGYAFQDFKIIPDKTISENIAIALEILNYQDKLIKERVDHLLELTGLTGKGQLFPIQLSGGELQRVSIARALATEPVILLADEPTGNLDDVTGAEIVKLLEQINDLGTTIIVATHNQHLMDHHRVRRLHLEKGKITDTPPKIAHKKTSDKNKELPEEPEVKKAKM